MPADSKIKKIPITGGASIQLTDGFLSDGADWGDDDTIVFSSPQGLKRVSAAGGAAEQLTKLDVAKGEQVHRRPQFLPDGKHVLFTIRSASSETQQFAVVDLAGGAYRTIAPGGDNGRYVSSGHLTYGRQGTVFAVPFDLDRLAVAGPEVPVIESVSATGPPGTCDYTVSGNGLLVYSEGLAAQGSTLMWADRKGTLETIPGQVMRRWGTGRLSPDGLRLANGIHAEKGTDIWVMDLAKGTPTRLTFGGENDRPVWAPDGRSVVYGADAGGKFGLYSVATDGSGAPVQVLATERYSYPLSFSHGKTLLFRHSEPGGRAQIFVVDLGTGNPPGAPRLLREGTAPDLDAQFSPDGKWVAFTSAETGSPEVYVMAFPGPGGRTRVSTSGGRDPRWAKNGRELLFWGSAPGSAPMFSAAVQTSPSLAVSVPTELFRMTAGTTWDPVPNHDRLLVENSRSPGVATVFATVTDWFEELRQRAPVRK
jgi:serine/threonine-protein kinase